MININEVKDVSTNLPPKDLYLIFLKMQEAIRSGIQEIKPFETRESTTLGIHGSITHNSPSIDPPLFPEISLYIFLFKTGEINVDISYWFFSLRAVSEEGGFSVLNSLLKQLKASGLKITKKPRLTHSSMVADVSINFDGRNPLSFKKGFAILRDAMKIYTNLKRETLKPKRGSRRL